MHLQRNPGSKNHGVGAKPKGDDYAFEDKQWGERDKNYFLNDKQWEKERRSFEVFNDDDDDEDEDDEDDDNHDNWKHFETHRSYTDKIGGRHYSHHKHSHQYSKSMKSGAKFHTYKSQDHYRKKGNTVRR